MDERCHVAIASAAEPRQPLGQFSRPPAHSYSRALVFANADVTVLQAPTGRHDADTCCSGASNR